MNYNPYPWAYPNIPNTSVPIAGQTEATYLNWKKTQAFDNVGWFLTSYVVEGGYVTKNAKQNDRIDISLTEFVLDNALQQRQAIQGIKLKNPNSTYFVDVYQGDYRVETAHPPGIAGKDYLTLATVTTDAIGNVNTIIDTAKPRGGFRLKDEYGLFGYMRRVFNVSDYGAKGDGVTDDYQSIQSAIMAAKAAGGGLVFFPNGKYIIGKTLNFYKGINISGTSTDAVQLINQTNDTCIQFLGQEENDRLFATIDNLTITSYAKGNTLGLRVRNAGGFTLNNVNIINQKLGFWVAGSNAVTVNRCDIIECTTGILVGSDPTSIGVVYVDGFTLSNSNLGGNIIHIIDTGSHSLGSRFYVGNAFYSYAPTQTAIWMGGTKGVVISGNWFEMGDGSVAIRLDYKDPDGVVINTPFGTEITGNSFGSRGDIFIDIREAAATVIEGNTFSGAALYCIKVRTGAGRNQIGANMYENIIGVPISVDFPEFTDILDNSKDTIRGIRQKKGGVATLIQDGSNGYFEVTMPVGGVNWSKVSISTLWKASATANYTESPTQISWKDMDSITVRIMVAGKTSGTMSYNIIENY